MELKRTVVTCISALSIMATTYEGVRQASPSVTPRNEDFFISLVFITIMLCSYTLYIALKHHRNHI